MAYTNETTHYGIPLPLGSDLTTPMDYNESMQDVDTALFESKTDSSSALQKANQLQQDLATTNGNVTAVTGRVTTLEGTVTTQGQSILQNTQDISDVRADALDMIEAKDEGTAQVASVAVAKGEYFRYNDVLYIATQTIGVGDTIVPNTNCRATNVGTELNQLNSDLANISQNTPDVVIDNTGRKNGQMLYLLLQQINFSKVNANTKLEVGTNIFTLCTLDTTNQHLRFSRTDLTNTGSVRIINANIQDNSNIYVASEGGTFSDLSEESATAPFIIYY